MIHHWRQMVVVMVLAGCAAWARATPVHVNLLINGDAETGDATGWVSTGGEAISSANAGAVGLGPGDDLGAFSFTGALGDSVQALAQTIDVSDLAAAIDAGQVDAIFDVLVQARTVGVTDTAGGSVQFLSELDAALDTFNFSDPSAAEGVFDWAAIHDQRLVPTGTRRIVVDLVFTRTSGASSDGFADNASLVLTPEPGAAAAMFMLVCVLAGRWRVSRSAAPAA